MDPNQPNAQQTQFIDSPKLHGDLGKSVTNALRLKEPLFSEHATVTSLVEDLVKDEDLIHLFGKYVEERLSECSGQYEKIAAHSKVLREKGNVAYQKKKFDEALQLYDESIVFATGPPDSTSVALAYANRSAVLFEKKAYQKCLKDIERALSNGYSENLKYKLYRRQAECYVKTGRTSDALRSADSALEASCYTDLVEDKKAELINDLKNLRNKIGDSAKSDDNEDKPTFSSSESIAEDGLASIIQETELAHGKNPKLPTVSSSLKVGFNQLKGRHMLVDSNLQLNDILIVEKPYACILFLDYINYHCWNCTVNLVSEDVAISTVPCDNCTEVRYCSEKCRDQAWEEFHYFECGCLTMLPDFGYPHLPLRIILKAGVHKVLQTKEILNASPQANDTDLLESFSGNTAESASYNTIRSLQSHQENAEFSSKWDAVTIALLSLKWIEICYKKHLKYMTRDPVDPYLSNVTISELSAEAGAVQNGDVSHDDNSSFRLTVDQRTHLASAFVLHYFQCKCNSYSITELYRYMSECSTVVGQIADRTVAVAVYPSFSLFNHDCDPNVGTFPYRNVMIGRAIKNIGSGKEACISYGTTWWEAHVQHRRDFLLKNFSFNCTCRSCQFDQSSQDKFLAPLDPTGTPSKPEMSLLHVLDLFHQGNDLVPQEQYVRAIEVFLESQTLLCKDVKYPRKNFTRIYWKSHDQLLLCFERLISQCSFDGDQQKHLCSFNTGSIRYASTDRLTKMQAALKEAMQCAVNDVDSGSGRESDLLCNIALDYVCVLLKITRQRKELCFDEDWYGLAKESLDIVKKILLLKKGLGGVGSNLRMYSQFVEDVFMVLECWVAEGQKQTLTRVGKDDD